MTYRVRFGQEQVQAALPAVVQVGELGPDPVRREGRCRPGRAVQVQGSGRGREHAGTGPDTIQPGHPLPQLFLDRRRRRLVQLHVRGPRGGPRVGSSPARQANMNTVRGSCGRCIFHNENVTIL